MAPKHDKIISELCFIIEQFVLTDVNEEKSTFYRPNDKKYKFRSKISPNDPAIVRFKKLLATPNLDVGVSTSENNSLIAHAVMFVALVIDDARSKRRFGAPILQRSRHLFDLLARHRSVDVNVPVRIKWASGEVTSNLIIHQIMHQIRAFADKRSYDPWTSIVDKTVIDSKMPFHLISWVFDFVTTKSARRIVNNPKFDPSITSSLGEPVLNLLLHNFHHLATEDMMKMPSFRPNRLSPPSNDREGLDEPDPEDLWIHYVLHAAGGFPKYETEASPRVMKRLVRAVLAHKDTDISQVRPYTNGRRSVNATSMRQMLGHETFDIHNVVILPGDQFDDAPPDDDDLPEVVSYDDSDDESLENDDDQPTLSKRAKLSAN